ncbi:MAG: hypothetical protein OHK0056_06500 [Bacteriovoracaceae bacterium]
MKRILISLMISSLTANVAVANDQTDALFAKRGESTANAQKAADLARDLAKTETDQTAKGKLKYKEAEYIYFVGVRANSKEEKKALHERGFEAAKVAISLLAKDAEGKVPTSPDLTSALATAHYFFAINLGKWGEANGVLSSLSRWPELKDHLDIIDQLDTTVQDYGSSRTRARALHKLPFGNKDEALSIISNAFDKTMSDSFDLSKNSTTVLYYLDLLVKTKKDVEKFCKTYDAFSELTEFSADELRDYNEDRVPETLSDLAAFQSGDEFEEKVEKYYKNNCR